MHVARVLVAAALCLLSPAPRQSEGAEAVPPTPKSSTPVGPGAADLMKRGLYQDAIRALDAEIKGRPEAECGDKFLMLGECYYLLKMYNEARPYFVRAKRYLQDEASKVIAEYRLACVAYRMGDAAAAIERINEFVAKYPKDRRSGTLLFFKMNLVARKGKGAMGELEAIHRQIRAGERVYQDALGVAADKVLTDFYVAHGEEEKARQRYTSTVHSSRNVIAEYAKEKRPVPEGLEQAHDHAAMQLGAIALKAKKFDEATRWLETVKYVPELKREARLLLAQVAYQKRDFDRAIWHLTNEGFIETVPAGTLRSDMYLLLGLAERGKPQPNLNKVVEWLSRVDRAATGYCQAQLALGELFRERALLDRAIASYENAVASPKYEAQALLALGELYAEQAGNTPDKTQQEALYRKAAEKLNLLTTKYPTSQLAKQASKTADLLLGKGIEVTVALSDQQMVQRWERTARENPGSAEAARSLIGLIRLHHKAVLDPKGQKLIKAPNYAACAAACDKLLDPKVYTGKDLADDQWRDLRVEALYHRGLCHLASATATDKDARGPVTPQLLKPASVDQALDDLAQAKAMVNPKHLDLVKGIELGLLEAMFKSVKPDLHKRAEARFAELVNEYGTDVRFQKLALDLAAWYEEKGRLADAAKEYKGIAERGANLSQEDRLKALFQAGRLYSKAAAELKAKPGSTAYGIQILPKEVFKLPDILKLHKPFQKKIALTWPEKARDLSAQEALVMVSQASGIPFVWSPEGGGNSVADYLRRKRVKFDALSGTVEDFLRQILDMANHRLDFDIGLTEGKPTIAPAPPDPSASLGAGPDDPEAETPRVIEIYDARQWARRFKPLARDYGAWRSIHPKPAMLFHVLQRIEELSDTKVLWAEGVEKEHALGTEYSERDGKLWVSEASGAARASAQAVPGLDPHRSVSCAEMLAALLAPLDLRYLILPRNRSAELYEEAKGAFNQIRQIDPKSAYGERALFLVAINYYHQEDFERMKLVLTDYLRIFDSPTYEHHHQACFWVGWVLEREKRYREACRYYNRAAEERLVVFKPKPDEKRLSRDELKALLSYETRFALEEPVNGAFKDYTLEKDFADFVRLSANVTLRLDPSALTAPVGGNERPALINRAPFKQTPVFTLLCDTLDGLGLSFRVENVAKDLAERAYYRLASAYHKDGLMDQALASISVLLDRYPATPRKRDALKLKLDIYKGLKDYKNVLATLAQFKAELGDQIEAYKIDFEMACIYFDLCRYAEAAEHFKKALAGTQDPRERLNIRDGYARALFRADSLAEAANQFHALTQEERDPLRNFVNSLMAWGLKALADKEQAPQLPPEAAKLIAAYEALRDEQRSALAAPTIAKVTWVYYVTALLDLQAGQTARALRKLEAAGNSPDDWLAADAIYRAAELHLKAKDLKKARETLEYLLFSTKSAEAEVKATYLLAQVHQELGEADRARERRDQVLTRFPDSLYADKIRAASRVPREEEKAKK